MVSVVSGSGLGLVNTSRGVVGVGGELGQGSLGRAGERVTVNAANGNLVVQNQDGLLVGVGADVGLLRTYNSLGGWDGDNGDAWRLGYYRRIGGLSGTLNAAGSTLVRTDADGFESTYTWRDGRYVGTDGTGAYDTLVIDVGTATWTDGDTGLTENYVAAAGGSYRLTQITDPDGHAIRVAYDPQGLIASLSTWKAGAASADETLTLAYDGNRRLTQVSTNTRSADGSLRTQTRVYYTYDTAGRLAGVVTDLSPEDNSTVDGRNYNVNYTYDGAGRLRTLTQTDGSALTIDYDDAGRVRRITDALGRATTFGYDTSARQTSVTDALGQVARLAYDSTGRLGELSGTGFQTRFAYDADGNLLSSTNGLGQQTVFGYDGHGNPIRSTDASGRVLERSFDAANRQTGETQYAQPGVGQTTRYVYDTSGGLRRLRFSLSAEGRVSEQLGNALGQSLGEAMLPRQGIGPWSDKNYENGADIEDSIARTNREAAWSGTGLRLGGGGTGLRVTDGAAAAWANDIDRGIRDNARALTNFDAAAGKVWTQEDAQAALNARASLVKQNANAEAYGRELAQARQQSLVKAIDPMATVLGYAQSYPALAREIAGYEQLVAAGLMTPQQAQDSLLASPRAYATLRSDYETPAASPVGGPSLTPWDGVTRSSPAEAYLAKARGGLDAVRGDSLHFQVAQGLPDAASLMVGDLAVARVAGMLGRAAAPVQGLMFGERAMLMSSWRAEMAAGLAGDLAVMPGLAAETLSARSEVLTRTGAKLSFDSSLNAVDRSFGLQAGELISRDPVARASYARLQRQGTDVYFVNDPNMRELGVFDPYRNTVTVNMLRHSSAEEAASTVVHEAVHQNRFFQAGVAPTTQFEEYLAFRNEFLFTEKVRPTLFERQEMMRRTQELYPHLPAGPNPFGVTR